MPTTHPSSPASGAHAIPDDVLSFYHLCDGEFEGKACQGTACFAARHFNPARWAEAERNNPRVYCLGECFAAPAKGQHRPRPPVKVCAREGIVLGRIAAGGARSLSDYVKQGGYAALRQALGQPAEKVLAAVEASGLRGRGGAGFPTGRKWRAVAQQPPGLKYVVANADEGDAGAYIDRYLMEDDPHSLIEGMVLAAYAVGAGRGYIYVRAEYPLAATVINAALAEARAAGWLGQGIGGTKFSFELETYVGHGSYVCGEETALLRSIEGKRPEVMARPPYPTERGLFDRPTLLNNVETLVTVPWIVRHGGEAYAAIGFSKSRGTKALSLNSLFNRPGLYEVEFGVTVRHIVEELGGGLRNGAKLKGVLIGGPIIGMIPPHLIDTPLGFEELAAIGAGVGHGGVVAFDEHTSIPDLVQHVFAFGAYESCGKCTPCRSGSGRVEEIFAAAVAGRARAADLSECRDLVTALKLASLCGHGTGLARFAESILRYYPTEIEPCFK
ncbi:MAG TPA: NADH-ubiquinone oxidoreductase-F iron-sulfur binding region domain-containing protein [Opitutaceae bacterium]|nr:NADH-ubiquinone oxidoreductase-F iron-sulfur binding region domain-containing protein [Opitutaceae bacterium]HND60655.1 NADH-ubiquinone oxidoreductase-F iron-sulfur binding region domain-containing protein [Opitutaceae bacterium]